MDVRCEGFVGSLREGICWEEKVGGGLGVLGCEGAGLGEEETGLLERG